MVPGRGAALSRPVGTPPGAGSVTLVDAHVHLQARFDPERFLSGARSNFRRHAPAGGEATGVLVLTEAAGLDLHGRLRAWASGTGRTPSGRWALEETAEQASLLARPLGERPDAGAAPEGDGADDGAAAEAGRVARLVLVAGGQVRAERRLEVLTLGGRPTVPEGLPLDETVAAVEAAGVPAVVPWGFGKWWLGRASAVADLLGRWRSPALFLGDNGGRPAGWPEPPLFRRARAAGVWVLPGSDPLPLEAHESRGGSYGFALAGGLPEDRPWAALEARLGRLEGDPPRFGERTGTGSFVRDQLALRLG